jgi:L-iditol 2-dehydrogenase
LIQDDELLLKVLSCAICGSDLKISKVGNARIVENRTIGHEISGEVIKVGKNVLGFRLGDTVSIGADLPCHNCQYCKSGNVNLCKTNLAIGYQFDGGFSQYMVVNKHVLKNGPIQKFKKIDPDIACLAEPLACAINGVEKSLQCYSSGKPGSALIFGGGPMGILLAEYLYYNNISNILIIEKNKDRLKFIETNTKFIAQQSSIQISKKFDLIFTACPAPETHSLSLDLIDTSGVINFFGGLPPDAPKISLNSNSIHYSESVLMGTHGSSPRHHKIALNLLEKNKINLDFLITHKFSLNQIQEAFKVANSGYGQKIIINPNE